MHIATSRRPVFLALVLAVLMALAVPLGTPALADPDAAFAQIGPTPIQIIEEDTSQAIHYPGISADGTTIVFEGSGPGITQSAQGGAHIFVYDVASGAFEQVDVDPAGRSDASIGRSSSDVRSGPHISADGRYVLFRHAANLDGDRPAGGGGLHVRDTEVDETTLVSVGENGETFSPFEHAMSDDGDTVIVTVSGDLDYDVDQPVDCQDGQNLLYAIDVPTEQVTLRALPADGICRDEAGATDPVELTGEIDLSGDGRYAVYSTTSDRLIEGPTGPADTLQVYREDLQTGEVVLVSEVAGDGGNGDSFDPSISADGRVVAYQSEATDLVDADDNVRFDIFVTDVPTGETRLVSLNEDGVPGRDDSSKPELSADGRYVTFVNEGRLSGPEDTRDGPDLGIYRADLSGTPAVRVDLHGPPAGTPGGTPETTTGVANDGSVAYVTDLADLQNPGGLFLAPSGGAAAPPTDQPPPAGPSTDAVIEFAVDVSGVRFGEGGTAGDPAAYAVVSRDDAFADSLSGAVLSQDGPLLFTPTGALDARTRAEVDRVLGGTGTVYLLGGTGAISPQVEQALSSAGYTVVRLSGDSRFETSARIAQEARTLFGDTGRLALARAFGPEGNPTAAWADSVTGGGWASGTGTPIVLTTSDALHPAVAAFVTSDAPQSTVLLGGTSAISADIEGAVPGPVRIAGQNRAETAAQIATDLFGLPPEGARFYAVINAESDQGWAFGLAGAGLSGDGRIPILATGNAANPPATLAAVAGCGGQVTLVRFGPIDQALFDALDAQDSRPC